MPVEPPKSDPPQQEKGKAAARSVSFKKEIDDRKEVNDDDDDNFSEDNRDDYVSHCLYRDIVAEGFDKRSPSRLAPSKPAYFSIDDPVTRTLANLKIFSKSTRI